MKLEVGMYCYDKCNRKLGIGKILTEPSKNNNVGILYNYGHAPVVSIGNVIASYKIIDLLKEGDYVDGCYIQEIKSVKNGVMECLLDSDYECISTIRNDEISKVLTKECFESMQYEVK